MVIHGLLLAYREESGIVDTKSLSRVLIMRE